MKSCSVGNCYIFAVVPKVKKWAHLKFKSIECCSNITDHFISSLQSQIKAVQMMEAVTQKTHFCHEIFILHSRQKCDSSLVMVDGDGEKKHSSVWVHKNVFHSSCHLLLWCRSKSLCLADTSHRSLWNVVLSWNYVVNVDVLSKIKTQLSYRWIHSHTFSPLLSFV